MYSLKLRKEKLDSNIMKKRIINIFGNMDDLNSDEHLKINDELLVLKDEFKMNFNNSEVK